MTSLFNDPRLPQRFWDKITPEPNSGCWIWTACCDQDGYGKCGSSPFHKSHRWIYEILIHQAPIPSGMVIHHLCKVKSCCNPAHLEMKTHKLHSYEHGIKDIENGKILGNKFGVENGKLYGALGGKISGKLNGAQNGKQSSKPCIATIPHAGSGYILSFSSTMEAARQLNIKSASRHSIGECCDGKRKTAGGFIWA